MMVLFAAVLSINAVDCFLKELVFPFHSLDCALTSVTRVLSLVSCSCWDGNAVLALNELPCDNVCFFSKQARAE